MTLEATALTVLGIVLKVQRRRIAGITSWAGTISTTTAIAANDKKRSARVRVYQGITFRRRWRNDPDGIDRKKPANAGIAVSRLTSRLLPPRRRMKTGRK